MTGTGSALVVVFAAMVSLSGCSQGRGVTVPPGWDQLAPCPIAQISIDDLSGIGEPGCDLTGSSLTFTNGSSALTIPSVGAVFSSGDGTGRETLIVNWGVPGVGVATIDNHRLIQIWASGPGALDLQKQQLALQDVETK